MTSIHCSGNGVDIYQYNFLQEEMMRQKSFVYEGIHGITDQLKTLKEEIRKSKPKKVGEINGFQFGYTSIVP